MMWLFFGTLLVMSVVSCVLRVKTGNIMYMNYYRTIHSNILSLPPLGVWGMKEMTRPSIRRMGAAEQSTGFITVVSYQNEKFFIKMRAASLLYIRGGRLEARKVALETLVIC